MFSKDLDSIVKWIPQTPGSYNRFAKAIKTSPKRNIPRGYRKEYIPGWNNHYENLMDDYRENGNEDVADACYWLLNNGLPQGSVLAPLLFNLYVHDMPKTKSYKFQYADDTAL